MTMLMMGIGTVYQVAIFNILTPKINQASNKCLLFGTFLTKIATQSPNDDTAKSLTNFIYNFGFWRIWKRPDEQLQDPMPPLSNHLPNARRKTWR